MNIDKLKLKEKETLILLFKKESTIEEILEEGELNYKELIAVIRKLLRNGFIVKGKGFPTKYRVKKREREKVIKLAERLDWSELEKEECTCG
ncbi:MAG: hypothetical protein ABIE23_06305 [archaeon]|nr:hypothetical protein [Candidatus Micrarchaeota archaeon]